MLTTDRPLTAPLRLADRWFRAWGVVTLVLLAVTGVLLAIDARDWRIPFALAHLAALIALAPLGVLLVTRAFIEAGRDREGATGRLAGVVRRYPLVTLLALVSAITVTLSLANFPDGDRAVRTSANLSTVAIVLVLVAHYLRQART